MGVLWNAAGTLARLSNFANERTSISCQQECSRSFCRDPRERRSSGSRMTEMRLPSLRWLLAAAAAMLLTACSPTSPKAASTADGDPRAAELAREVRNLGWIFFGARSDKG